MSNFEKGILYINGDETKNISNVDWDNHPKFSGVFTKNIFSGKDSNDNISAMIVKIEPQHEIGNHIHEGKSELHEIISGEGSAVVGSKKINYKPGVISIIPGNIPHSVKAGDKGIILLAKFTPPLN